MQILLEDRFSFLSFELGLEGLGWVCARVGPATRIGEIVGVVFEFIARMAPVAFTTAVLLGRFGINAGVSRLGEVLREVLLGTGGAVSEASVVTVVELVGASHDCVFLGCWYMSLERFQVVMGS
jgi:hypothetical protein